MLMYPEIDPVAIGLGPIQVHWYGLMYLIGFLGGWWLGRVRAGRPGSGWTGAQVDDLVFYVALGVILGGRIGYVVFYQFQAMLADPLVLFRIWEGGMSFHGGLIGVLLAVFFFARRHDKRFMGVTDFVAPLVPLGLLTGRIGNFINGELWGRPTDLPWGMVFPHVDTQARHPSQLYEAALEGVLLFLILWIYSRKPRPLMAVSGQFLIWYGLFRFLVEFVREPDAHLGFIAFDWLTMGQILSAPMILAGIVLYLIALRLPKPEPMPSKRSS